MMAHTKPWIWRFFLALCILGPLCIKPPLLQANEELFDKATGYRIARYRSPTPPDVPGGKRINIEDFDRLIHDEKAIAIDVMKADGAGPEPNTGSWRLTKNRESIPGAVWLADVGKGRLSEQMANYLASNLKRLTAGDATRPIIMFCLADCWMSWNAVRRAAALGYKNVYWYADGTDGWRDWDRKLVDATPRPVAPAQVAANTKTKKSSKKTNTLPNGRKTVTLVTGDGQRLEIASATFAPGAENGTASFSVTLKEGLFREEFLSMRPFLCLPGSKEMWCHLAYPYQTKRLITATDLQDLEYAFLFLFKPPTAYGIDAWNGLYFKLKLQPDGTMNGVLHETDLNVLAVPPEKNELRPITHGALSEIDSKTRRFATIEIR